MLKRDITETTYEYDKEGKLIKKTVIEKHEEESNNTFNYPISDPNTINSDWWKQPFTVSNPCDTNTSTTTTITKTNNSTDNTTITG